VTRLVPRFAFLEGLFAPTERYPHKKGQLRYEETHIE
jgi:hypothetical protein